MVKVKWCLLVAYHRCWYHISGRGHLEINLKNADIREFISQVSTITGRSFIIDPRVKGDVTVVSSTAMDRDGIYELFLSVLQVHGFAAYPQETLLGSFKPFSPSRAAIPMILRGALNHKSW